MGGTGPVASGAAVPDITYICMWRGAALPGYTTYFIYTVLPYALRLVAVSSVSASVIRMYKKFGKVQESAAVKHLPLCDRNNK